MPHISCFGVFPIEGETTFFLCSLDFQLVGTFCINYVINHLLNILLGPTPIRIKICRLPTKGEGVRFFSGSDFQ